MKKLFYFVVVLAGLWAADTRLSAAMTDSEAMAAVFKIWGDNGYISRSRKFGDFGWTYNVGCIDFNTKQPIIAGSAKVSFDAALLTVDMTQNGPHVLTAVARDNNGGTATSEPVLVFSCNPMAAAPTNGAVARQATERRL